MRAKLEARSGRINGCPLAAGAAGRTFRAAAWDECRVLPASHVAVGGILARRRTRSWGECRVSPASHVAVGGILARRRTGASSECRVSPASHVAVGGILARRRTRSWGDCRVSPASHVAVGGILGAAPNRSWGECRVSPASHVAGGWDSGAAPNTLMGRLPSSHRRLMWLWVGFWRSAEHVAWGDCEVSPASHLAVGGILAWRRIGAWAAQPVGQAAVCPRLVLVLLEMLALHAGRSGHVPRAVRWDDAA